MSGLFSTFGIATRGMSTQQKAIDVTAHNISNANTDGYSRQRAEIETARPQSIGNAGQMGMGANVASVDRVRDSFLDFQTRAETTSYGLYTAKDQYLSEIDNFLNEPSETGLSKSISNYFGAWSTLAGDPSNTNSRTLVKDYAATLANGLNHNYKQLEDLKDNAHGLINDTVLQINSYLDQIDKLNQQIISVNISKNNPNDLKDKRDFLLDKLSKEFGITLDKRDFEGNDLKPNTSQAAPPFDVTTTPPANSSMIKSENNDQEMRLSYYNVQRDPSDPTKGTLTYFKNGNKSDASKAVTISLTGLTDASYKFLNESRVIWSNMAGNAVDGSNNEITATTIDCSDMSKFPIKIFNPSNGEVKGFMSVQADIDGYEDQLNKLAKAIALSTNILHSGETDGTKDTTPFFVNKDKPSDEAGINASNISVNPSIVSDPMKIKAGRDSDPASPTYSGATNHERADALSKLADSVLDIADVTDTSTRSDFAIKNPYNATDIKLKDDTNGTKISTYFKDIVNDLGIKEQEAKQGVSNQEKLLADYQQSRDQVSGVSIDEEVANLVQYQHAYQANAKVISTLDQLLDVVINGLIK